MKKRCRFLTVLWLLSTTISLFAQSDYEMIVEQTDGNKHYFKLSDIKEVYFAKKEDVSNNSIEALFDYLTSEQLGGRYSGSEGIKKAERYICDFIGRSNSLKCVSFQTEKCEMTNIIFRIEGESDSLIVVGAHYDAFGYVNKTALPGADDNISGVAVLLQVIKAIQKTGFRPHYSMEICFWDGEEIGRYGSKYYVSHQDSPIKLYINVDTCGNPKCGLTCAYSDYAPNIVNELANFQEELNMQVEEYHPVNYTTDCEYFSKMRIPFVNIINDIPLMPSIHSKGDDISCVSLPRIQNISVALYGFLLSF
jgi:Zn-dependent M28 family amino/carboxypeptidase